MLELFVVGAVCAAFGFLLGRADREARRRAALVPARSRAGAGVSGSASSSRPAWPVDYGDERPATGAPELTLGEWALVIDALHGRATVGLAARAGAGPIEARAVALAGRLFREVRPRGGP